MCSTPPYSEPWRIDVGIFGINRFLLRIEMAPPKRFFNFPLQFPKMASKVGGLGGKGAKKIENFFFSKFVYFLPKLYGGMSKPCRKNILARSNAFYG